MTVLRGNNLLATLYFGPALAGYLANIGESSKDCIKTLEVSRKRASGDFGADLLCEAGGAAGQFNSCKDGPEVQHFCGTKFIDLVIKANTMSLIMSYFNPLHIQITCLSKNFVTLICHVYSKCFIEAVQPKSFMNFSFTVFIYPNLLILV